MFLGKGDKKTLSCLPTDPPKHPGSLNKLPSIVFSFAEFCLVNFYNTINSANLYCSVFKQNFCADLSTVRVRITYRFWGCFFFVKERARGFPYGRIKGGFDIETVRENKSFFMLILLPSNQVFLVRYCLLLQLVLLQR